MAPRDGGLDFGHAGRHLRRRRARRGGVGRSAAAGTALAIGVVTSMIAAWLPARNAARVDPVQALQKGKYQVLTAGENRARRLTAAALMAAAVACLWIAADRSGSTPATS